MSSTVVGVGEGNKGAGEETEVNVPLGAIRTGLELTPSVGTVEDGPSRTVEGPPARLEETTLLEETGDWVGRLAAGSVGFTKTVEVTVIMTGPPAAGSVACGIPSAVEEGSVLPS